jgi:hypothetical protein
LAKITRTQQRRLVASSIAFILTAALMTPSTTDARGNGDSRGHAGGARNLGMLGFTQSRTSPSPGISVVLRGSSFSARHAFSLRHVAFRHSRALGSHFFTLGADGVWVDNFADTPAVVVTQQPVIMLQQPAAGPPASVKMPSAAQQGILVVRGDSKSYMTFPNVEPG